MQGHVVFLRSGLRLLFGNFPAYIGLTWPYARGSSLSDRTIHMNSMKSN